MESGENGVSWRVKAAIVIFMAFVMTLVILDTAWREEREADERSREIYTELKRQSKKTYRRFVPCPECGHEFEVVAGKDYAEDELICGGCGHVFDVDYLKKAR